MALGAMLRGVPLFFCARPKTPLRILCIMAFDMLYMLRNAKSLPMHRLRVLAALLDFGACANAFFDHKARTACCRQECHATLRLLEEAGFRSLVVEYLRRLEHLERRRPLPGGDDRQFQIVRLYRESVVRLSLGAVAAAAQGSGTLDTAIGETRRDHGLDLLFRIVMQCQIIDDVLDYSSDLPAGLPSFSTACELLPQAIELTRLTALGYADVRGLPWTCDLVALRAALFLVSKITQLVIVRARWRQRLRDRLVEPEFADCHIGVKR
jgi:hypothetical protein